MFFIKGLTNFINVVKYIVADFFQNEEDARTTIKMYSFYVMISYTVYGIIAVRLYYITGQLAEWSIKHD